MMAGFNICKYAVSRRVWKSCLSDLSFVKCNGLSGCGPGKTWYSTGARFNFRSIRQSNVSLIAVGVGAGAVVGAGYSWHKFKESKHPVVYNPLEKEHRVLETLPDVEISRSIKSTTDTTNLKLVLFQYPTCPFCCKVRAFLDYYGFAYDVVEVDPVLRTQTKWTDYKKVPILLAKVDGKYQQLNDSSMIVSTLMSLLSDPSNNLTDVMNFYPLMEFRDNNGTLKTEIMNRYFLMYHNIPKGMTSETIIAERNWRKWADDVLVHTLSPNVYRTREEAMQAFNWFSEVGEWDRLFPSWEKTMIIYVGALAMWGIGKRLKKRHGLKEDVRESLYDECNKWMREIKTKNTTFFGGETPNLADLAVYGVLSSIEGCSAFQDLTTNTSIGKWFYPMKDAVKNHKGSQVRL